LGLKARTTRESEEIIGKKKGMPSHGKEKKFLRKVAI